MTVKIDNTLFSYDLFALKEDNKLANADKFIEGLTYLANNALDALKKPDDVEAGFENIETIENDQKNLGANRVDINQLVQEVFRNWVKIQFGDQSRYIPRKRLQEQCGEKFKLQFTNDMVEATAKAISLELPGMVQSSDIDETIKKAFLVYLQTGVISDEDLAENMMDYLCLAEQHGLNELVAKCSLLLEANLKQKSLELKDLKFILENIENRNLPTVKWICLTHMYAHVNDLPIELRNRYEDELVLLASLPIKGINLKLTPQGKMEMKIESFENGIIEIIKQINTRYPIHSMTVGKRCSNIMPFFKQIAPLLTNVEELMINDASFKANQYSQIKAHFPKLSSFGNDGLVFANFNQVKEYLKSFKNPENADQDSDKPYLRSLNLTKIQDLSDTQLEELTPYLQEIYHLFIKSDEITKAAALKATEVYCSDCSNLKTLKANQAKRVACYSCTNLQTLKVNQAEVVDCRYCTRLQTLEANQAKKVNCSGCKRLQTLEAKQAKEVYCNGCKSLRTLEANQAKRVVCYSCTSLRSLEAKQAEVVVCYSCTSLQTLEAKQAKRVVCYSCTSLQSLEAKQAEVVVCYSCTSLQTLEANQAKEVYCYNCTSLQILEANHAEVVDCNGCTKLQTF